MTITVFGATGQVGKKIVDYALAKGHKVRAFGRNVTGLIDEDLRSDQLEAIRGSVFNADEIFDAVKGADAVLSALGGAFDGTDKTRSLGIKNIVAQMQKAGVERVVALGNTAVLNAPGGGYILDEPDFPDEFLPVGREHLQAFLHLKNSNLNWTFVCSPEIKDEDATEHYITSNDYLPNPNKGYITTGDLAHFMITEAEKPTHTHHRVGISAI